MSQSVTEAQQRLARLNGGRMTVAAELQLLPFALRRALAQDIISELAVILGMPPADPHHPGRPPEIHTPGMEHYCEGCGTLLALSPHHHD